MPLILTFLSRNWRAILIVIVVAGLLGTAWISGRKHGVASGEAKRAELAQLLTEREMAIERQNAATREMALQRDAQKQLREQAERIQQEQAKRIGRRVDEISRDKSSSCDDAIDNTWGAWQ